jgi:hypothetical protein
MKILFAKGNSQYGSLRENADEIINYLQKQGHNIVVIDRKIEGVWENVPNVLDDTFDMVLSLQVLAYKIKVLMDASGKQIKGLKYISICGDHPIYINYWLKQMQGYPDAYLILSDKNQEDYVKKYYNWINTILLKTTTGKGCGGKKYSERKIDIFFGGTYYNQKEIMQTINKLQAHDKDYALEMIHTILQNEGMPLEDALKIELKKHGKELSENEFIDYLETFIPVDRYIRAHYRNEYIEAACRSTGTVFIYGNDWEKSQFTEYPNCKICSNDVTLKKGFKYMADSKIIINIMPWSRIGFHDRIVNIIKAGAICLTNTNQVIDNVFENGKEYLGFGLNEKDKITQKINWILEHPYDAAILAEKGNKKGNEYFTIENYCNTILNAIN